LELTFDKVQLTEALLPNGKHRITGEAIHPCQTYHPGEWCEVRQYVEPFLERAAHSMVGKPLVIDHDEGRYGRKLSVDNMITQAHWDPAKSAVVFEAEITEEVYRLFQCGELKPKVSVGVNWQKPGGGVIVGGNGQLIPYAFDFSELSLISQTAEPGDPLTNLQIWECVINEAKRVQAKPSKRFYHLGEMPPQDYSNCKHLGEQ
jgi:hypothetical protein